MAGIDKDQPAYDVATLENRIDHFLRMRCFVMGLSLASAIAGVSVTALGLYGILSCTVARRLRRFPESTQVCF